MWSVASQQIKDAYSFSAQWDCWTVLLYLDCNHLTRRMFMWITLFVAFQAATNQLECLSDTICMFKRLWRTVSTDVNKVLSSTCLCLHLSNTGHRPGEQTLISQVFISLNELCSHKTSPQVWLYFGNGLLMAYSVYMYVKRWSWLQSVYKANCTAWFLFKAEFIITIKGTFSVMIKRENYRGILPRDIHKIWKALPHLEF